MEPIGRFGKRVGLIKLGLDLFGFLNRLQNKLSPSSYMLNQLGSIRLTSIFSNNNNNNNNSNNNFNTREDKTQSKAHKYYHYQNKL